MYGVDLNSKQYKIVLSLDINYTGVARNFLYVTFKSSKKKKKVGCAVRTCFLTVSSTFSAVFKLSGYGMPCVMIVDSSATMGRPCLRAVTTSDP